MKRTIFNLLILMQFSAFSQSQVNLSGEWKGILYQEWNGGIKQYAYTMKLEDKNGVVTGSSSISFDNSYGIISLKGSVKNNRFFFQDFRIDEKKADENWSWCLKSGTLAYKKENNKESIEGKWTGYIKTSAGRQDCSPGRLVLKRVNDIVSFSGHVYDASTKAPLAASLSFTNESSKEAMHVNSSIKEGAYRVETKKGNDFFVFVQCKGYLNLYDTLHFSRTDNDFYLEPIVVGTSIKLHNMLFQKGTSLLVAESYSELDRLAEFLNQNPGIEIRLEGHTSNEGDEIKNQKLSEDRVKTVKDYLTEKGITASRITLLGFGSKKPLLPNTSDENRKQNRRVEFKITKS
jgi:outer membrane protein OmpA-like peptidoglycan-associated protein